jgi:hypothetical protein
MELLLQIMLTLFYDYSLATQERDFDPSKHYPHPIPRSEIEKGIVTPQNLNY